MEASPHAVGARDRLEAIYNYTDEHGQLLYQVLRLRPKDFRQRRPAPGGGWHWSLGNSRRVPYRLRDLLKTPPDQLVFVVEGEKDADNLWQRHLPATTCAMGAGKWRPEYNAALRGRPVVLLPDNDEPGRRHAQQVAQALVGVAESVRLLLLPGLPPKGDVSDWLAQPGHGAAQLLALAQAAPLWPGLTLPTAVAPAAPLEWPPALPLAADAGAAPPFPTETALR